MKWIEILRKDKYALLQSESDTQYVVVSGYDPKQPEDEQWSHGTYFIYWNDVRRKADCLQNALDYFRNETEEKRDLTAEEENAYIQNIVDICEEIMQGLSCTLVEAYKEISE